MKLSNSGHLILEFNNLWSQSTSFSFLRLTIGAQYKIPMQIVQ